MIKDLNTVKYILLGMVTLFFAVSCSNDDDPEPSDNSGNGSGNGSGDSQLDTNLTPPGELSEGKGQFAGVGDIQFTNKNASASWYQPTVKSYKYGENEKITLSDNKLPIKGKDGNNKVSVMLRIKDPEGKKVPEKGTFKIGLTKDEKLSESVDQWAEVTAETDEKVFNTLSDSKGEVVITQTNNDTLKGYLSAKNLKKFGTDSTVNVNATFHAPKQ